MELDNSVAIFCHGNIKNDETNFKIPDDCEIFTFASYNNNLNSNPDRLTKLFNNLRYCLDTNYLIKNKFFNRSEFHKWETGEFIPNMDLNFDCTILDSKGKVLIGKANRHGILTFGDESP